MCRYVSIEDVQKILDKYTFHSWIFRDEILSLPSIDFEVMPNETVALTNYLNANWERKLP